MLWPSQPDTATWLSPRTGPRADAGENVSQQSPRTRKSTPNDAHKYTDRNKIRSSIRSIRTLRATLGHPAASIPQFPASNPHIKSILSNTVHETPQTIQAHYFILTTPSCLNLHSKIPHDNALSPQPKNLWLVQTFPWKHKNRGLLTDMPDFYFIQRLMTLPFLKFSSAKIYFSPPLPKLGPCHLVPCKDKQEARCQLQSLISEWHIVLLMTNPVSLVRLYSPLDSFFLQWT